MRFQVLLLVFLCLVSSRSVLAETELEKADRLLKAGDPVAVPARPGSSEHSGVISRRIALKFVRDGCAKKHRNRQSHALSAGQRAVKKSRPD